MNKSIKRVIYYFLQGILLTTPIAITVYIIFILLEKIDSIIPFDIPGLGLLTLFSILTIVGYLGSQFISFPISKIFEKLLDKAPLIKTIYSSIKDLVSAFVGKEKRFNQPVLVKLSKDSNLQRFGFITREDLSHFGLPETKVAVYFPHSYAWSGNLMIVERENVVPVQAKPAEIMKLIVSGGVSSTIEIQDEN